MKRCIAVLLAAIMLAGFALAEVPTASETPDAAAASARTISAFYFSRMIEGGFESFGISPGEGGYLLSVNDGVGQPISQSAVDELLSAIDTFDLAGWNGFNESDYDVLDGESFRLEYSLSDGTSVSAAGDNAFPDNYSEAVETIWRILSWSAEENTDMELTIDGTPVPVTWEDNDAVDALRALCPLTLQLSMYDGFEQVGDIGAALPGDDAQITTQPGDIVLYSGDQIVIFYGSNHWAYTRLGHVDQPREVMEALLSGGDVVITIE